MNQQILDRLQEQFRDCPLKTYAKGKIITLANHDPAGVSLLISGLVEQYDITPEGNKITVNVFKPQAFFPMSWAINKTPNTYFFGALTDVELKLATADDMVAFLKANPDITFDLLSRVYRGTDGLLRRLMMATSGVASSRLILELLLEAFRFGVKMSDNKVLITAKQSAIAARSGLARETVSRELHKLQTEQYITLTKQGMILDTKQLSERLDLVV